MKNKIYKQVLERSEGNCELCGAMGNEMHHCIFGSGKRKQCERVESVVLLCYECHRGDSGVHGKDGKELDTKLKENLQQKYEQLGLEGEELRYWLGGKFYL